MWELLRYLIEINERYGKKWCKVIHFWLKLSQIQTHKYYKRSTWKYKSLVIYMTVQTKVSCIPFWLALQPTHIYTFCTLETFYSFSCTHNIKCNKQCYRTKISSHKKGGSPILKLCKWTNHKLPQFRNNVKALYPLEKIHSYLIAMN